MPMRRLLFTRQAVCLRNHNERRSFRFSDHESPREHYPFQDAGGQAAAGRIGHLWYETVPDFLARPSCHRSCRASLLPTGCHEAATWQSRVRRQAAPGDHAIGGRPASGAPMPHSVVAEIRSRSRVIRPISLRAICIGIRLCPAIGDRASDHRAGSETTQRRGTGAIVMPAPSTVSMTPVAMPISILHLLNLSVLLDGRGRHRSGKRRRACDRHQCRHGEHGLHG